MQIDFSDKQFSSRNQSNKLDRTNKQTNKYNNIDPNILIEHFRKNYSGCYNDNESIVEAEAILGELLRVKAITREEYNIFLAYCFGK